MKLRPRREPIITQVERDDDDDNSKMEAKAENTTSRSSGARKKLKSVKRFLCCLAAKKIRDNDLTQPINTSRTRISRCLLPPPSKRDAHLKCLVIDLDETLVHSSFKPVDNPDYVISIDIDGTLNDYADPVSDFIDKWGVFRHRLFRDACMFISGSYVKDLDQLGRSVDDIAIIDNSPASYAFHPDNAIAIESWFGDPDDRELYDLIPVLDDLYQCSNLKTMLQAEQPTTEATTADTTTPSDTSPQVT